MMRRGTADVPLAEQLALAHGGLSFVWPHTEADFRAWHARSRMPAIRIGGLGVIGA